MALTRPMVRRCSHLVFVCIALLVAVQISRAQEPAPDPASLSSREVLQALKDSLFDLNQEIDLLQHFLEAATVDSRSLWNTNIRSWRINNPVLRDSLFAVLVQIDSSVQAEAGAEAMILATPQNDLVEVRFGNAVFKGMTLKHAIDNSGDKGLYRKIASSYTYSPDIELRDPDVKIPTSYHPMFMDAGTLAPTFSPRPRETGRIPANIAAELGLNGLAVQVGEHWGGEIHLGFEEANLPFWSSGTFQILATYERVKFGAVLPSYGGRNGSTAFTPFNIRRRLLNGAPGIAASADFGIVGGSLAFLHMTSDDLTSLTDPDDFPSLSGYLTLYSSFGITLGEKSSARAKFGGGMRRISTWKVISPEVDSLGQQFTQVGQVTNPSPYFSFEYIRRGPDEYLRAGVQFFDLTVAFFAGIEVIPNVLSIEASYYWPVSPSPRGYENPDFLLVTPKLRIGF
jgi:hypothetical protein